MIGNIKEFTKLDYPLFNLISLVMAILLIMRLAFEQFFANIIIIGLVSFIVFTVISFLFPNQKKIELAKLGFIIILGIGLRLISVQMESGNDVFWASQGAVENLLSGINPYNATYFVPNNPSWADIPITTYAYLPGTIIFETPFYLIFEDTRYAILFADIAIAFLLYFIVRKKSEDFGRAAMSFYFLVTSLTFVFPSIIFDYRISDGLTDPIMSFLLLSTIYTRMNNHYLTSALFLGFALATRQFALLFFIVMMFLWFKKNETGNREIKYFFTSIIFASIIILPFFLNSPQDFINDTIITLGGQDLIPSLGEPQWNTSIPAQLVFFGLPLDNNISNFIQIVLIAGLLFILRKKIRDIISVVFTFTIIYVIFLAFSNFTQYFYWFNVIPYLIIIFAFILWTEKEPSLDGENVH